MAKHTESTEGAKPQSAGLFDIRFIIGSLIGIYGAITLLAGLFTSDKQLAKADGLNINVYAGIGMLVVAAGFMVWARVRPIVVTEEAAQPDAGDHHAH